MKKVIFLLLSAGVGFLSAMEPVEHQKKAVPSLKSLAQRAIMKPAIAEKLLAQADMRFTLNQLPQDMLDVRVPAITFEMLLNAELQKISTLELSQTSLLRPEDLLILENAQQSDTFDVACIARDIVTSQVSFLHVKPSGSINKIQSLNDVQNRATVFFLPYEPQQDQGYPLAAITIDHKPETTIAYNAQTKTRTAPPSSISTIAQGHYCLAIDNDYKKALIGQKDGNKKIWHVNAPRATIELKKGLS